MKLSKRVTTQQRQAIFRFSLIFFLISCATTQKEKISIPPSEIYYQQAVTSFELNQMDKAEKLFQRSIAIDPKYAPAHEGLARILLDRGELHKATLHTKRAIELDSTWLPAYILRGRLLISRGDFDSALEQFRQVTALQKRSLTSDTKQLSLQALYFSGVAYEKLKEWERAEPLLDHYCKQKPDDKDAKILLDSIRKKIKLVENKSDTIKRIARHISITKLEMALLVWEMRDKILQDKTSASNQAASDFPVDTTEKQAVQLSVHWGLLPIYPDSTFRPDKRLVRAELALLIYRLLDIHDIVINGDADMVIEDVRSVYPYYPAVNSACRLNILSLETGNQFLPYRFVYGLEAMSAMDKVIEIIRKSDEREGNN